MAETKSHKELPFVWFHFSLGYLFALSVSLRNHRRPNPRQRGPITCGWKSNSSYLSAYQHNTRLETKRDINSTDRLAAVSERANGHLISRSPGFVSSPTSGCSLMNQEINRWNQRESTIMLDLKNEKRRRGSNAS